uniref:Uncharacterized protein n=1 Tax=Parascaris equorum TaxID=6256 RepID=A0A914RYD8_PAREQ
MPASPHSAGKSTPQAYTQLRGRFCLGLRVLIMT